MSKKNVIAILAAAVLLPHCTKTLSYEDPIERVNASVDTSAVAVSSGRPPIRIPMLAIEVEVTADGVRPLGAKIVLAPPKANSDSGELRVQPTGIEGWSYTMHDPRIVSADEPDERRSEVLESARTFVFVPLLAAIHGLDILPVPGEKPDASRGGKFDVREFAREACRRTRSELPVCRQILEE